MGSLWVILLTPNNAFSSSDQLLLSQLSLIVLFSHSAICDPTHLSPGICSVQLLNPPPPLSASAGFFFFSSAGFLYPLLFPEFQEATNTVGVGSFNGQTHKITHVTGPPKGPGNWRGWGWQGQEDIFFFQPWKSLGGLEGLIIFWFFFFFIPDSLGRQCVT